MLSEVFGIFSGGVGIISVVLCSGDLKDFWGGGGDIFTCIARLKFLKGVKFSGIEIFSWGDSLIGRVTSKELKIFPMELGLFEKLRIFQVGGLRLFHNG